MIAHVSIPASNPSEIARFLASLIGGEAFAVPFAPGAWVAASRIDAGTTIEVYPLGLAIRPGEGEPDPAYVPKGPQPKPWEGQFFKDPAQSLVSAHHFAISSPLGKQEILRLSAEAGFRAVACERGGIFEVIEVWLENRLMIEFLTEAELARYRRFWSDLGAVKARFSGGGPPAAR